MLSNICVVGTTEGEQGERLGQLIIGRNNDPKFLNLLKNINPQIKKFNKSKEV